MSRYSIPFQSFVFSVVIVCLFCVTSCSRSSQKEQSVTLSQSDTIHTRLSHAETIDSLCRLMVANTNFDHVTTANGLPSQCVTCVVRDSQGFVWIGTSRGLARFDGVNVYVCPATLSKNVWSVAEIDHETCLVGTSCGLGLYNRRTDTWKDFQISSTIVKGLCKLPNGKVMVGTEDGLFLWNGKRERQQDSLKLCRIRVETGMGKSNHVTGFLLDGKRGCWFSTANGLGHYDIFTGKVKLYRMPVSLDNSNNFTCVTKYADTLFLGSFNKGVFAFDIQSRTFTKVNGFTHNLILKATVFGNYLLVATNGQGIKVKNLQSNEVYVIKHLDKYSGSLISNTVSEIQVLDDIPFIGTQFGGLSYLPRSAKWYDVYSYDDYSSSDYSVRYIYEFEDGAKMIATRSGLFYINEHKHLIKHFSEEDVSSCLRSDIVTFVNRVGSQVLVGTYGGGIHVFDRNNLVLNDFSKDELGLYGCIFDIEETEDGGMWIASQEGLYLLSRDKIVLKHFTPENSRLKSPAIFKLCSDSLGRLWVGTYAGLFIVDRHTHTILPCRTLPSYAKVNGLLLDSDQSMWVTSNLGLFHIDSNFKLVHKYDSKNGLPEDYVATIYKMHNHVFLVSTFHAITRLDLSRKRPTTHVLLKLPKESTFNNAPVMSDSMASWWTTDKGIFSIGRHANQFAHLATGHPFVSSYALDEVEFPLNKYSKKIEVMDSVKTVKFLFSNLQFLRPYANSYEYLLEGYDKEWHLLEGENMVTYTDLPCGSYVLKVRNPVTKDESRIGVHVQANGKVVFAIVCCCILLLAVLSYFGYKMTYLRSRLKKEREVLGEAINSKKITMEARKASMENADELTERLLEYMQKDKPYLNARLTVGELAARLSSTETDISLLLNTKMNMNWSYFVNAYRVEEMKQRLLTDGLSKYTISALAEQCGFVSKTTFYRIFKQMTGMTPAEYCRQNKISVSKD